MPAAAAPHQHQPRQCAESGGDQRENNRLQLDTNMAFAAARILKDKQQKEQQQENKRVIRIIHIMLHIHASFILGYHVISGHHIYYVTV